MVTVYLVSRWGVCSRHQRQYLRSSILSGWVLRFFVVVYRERLHSTHSNVTKSRLLLPIPQRPS